MDITYTDYQEISAPLAVVTTMLENPDVWDNLPIGAKRLGDMWRIGNELYTMCFDTIEGGVSGEKHPPLSQHNALLLHHGHMPMTHSLTLRWNMAPVTVAGAHIHIDVSLHDALVATHLIVRVLVFCPRTSWFARRSITKKQIASTIHACSEKLHSLIAQQSVAHHKDSDDDVAPMPEISPGSALQKERIKQSSHPLAEKLRAKYPRTVESFEAMQAFDHLERVWRLEQGWKRCINGEYDAALYQSLNNASTNPTLDFDIIYAGGGLGLLHAAVMARCYGKRVMVFDQGEVGCAHREWNISRMEFQALVDIGIVTWEELETVIMREYRTGLVKFHTGPYTNIPHSELWLPNVLSLAIDAQGLLQLMRRKLEEAGGTVLDHHAFRQVRVSQHTPLHVEVDVETLPKMFNGDSEESHPNQVATYRSRLLLDCMGSTSPLTLLRYSRLPFGGICPTVGSTVSGFAQGSGPREYDPSVGDILISVADTQHHRQLIWEGFPGRDDEMAVYVFYYAALNGAQQQPSSHNDASSSSNTASDEAMPFSLFELFEHYFSLLPTYKKLGPNFCQIKPLYGYIPGRHTLRPNEVPLLRGVLPVGDSAAQQSPLTYCGFGSHVRNLHRTTSLLAYALEHDLLESEHLSNIHAFQSNVSLNWVFSRFMQPWGQPDNVNELQNVFLGSLNDLGTPVAKRFFQDHTRWSDYNNILGTVLKRYPIIMQQAWSVLRPEGIIQWISDYSRFSLESFVAYLAHKAGSGFEQTLCKTSQQLSPALGLRIHARYAEWHVMKWLEQLPT